MIHSGPAAPGGSFRRAGRKLEQFVWQFRSYILPSHLWTYWSIVRAHGLTPEDAGRKCVCFDFTKTDIDASTARYLYALVRDFESLGYLTCYRRNFRFLATMRHKGHKRLLLKRPFRVYVSLGELPEGSVAAEVTDREDPLASRPYRRIRVRYEHRWPESDRELPMAFSVHPANYDRSLAASAPDLAAARSWRMFFAGSMARPRYGTDVLPVKFGKMSRVQMLDALLAALPPDSVRQVRSAEDLRDARKHHPALVLAETSRYRIPEGEWLEVLGRADFFLACPGVEMPLCHNLIEALSRGTVPILEHPEFLDPPLADRVNCLAFAGRAGLINLCQRAFQMSAEQIAGLRRGARAYYQKHLAPGRFAERVLSLPHGTVDLLLNAYRTPRLPIRGPGHAVRAD